MVEFNTTKQINGFMNRIVSKDKGSKDLISVNVKNSSGNVVDVKLTGKGVVVAGIAAVAPTAICVIGVTVAICATTKAVSRRKIKKRD